MGIARVYIRFILILYSSLLRLTGARRLRDGLRLWGSEPNSALKLCLCQLNARLGKAETEFRARTLQSEGRERSRGFIVESLPLIGSNYQRWLLSPIIHMTSVDSIPSPPGHHPPHSQCILQVNYQSAQSAHIISYYYMMIGPLSVSSASSWQWVHNFDWHGL